MRPLEDVNIVSLATNLPGPLAVSRLADLGATVTKVEPPTGDLLAVCAPDWYRKLIANQKVVVLDAKAPADRAELDRLLSEADLLVTAMRPSALARLGLSDPHLIHPRLSLIEIVGEDGDAAERPGHDLNYQALHGTLTPPNLPTVPLADILGAERAVSAAQSALLLRAKTGVGQTHRVVLAEAAARAADSIRYNLTAPGALLGGAYPAYGIYATADGYVALGAGEPHFWQRTMEIFALDGTHESVATAFATHTTAELEAIATRDDLPLTRVHQLGTTAA
ncbi:CoA transferase [Nocardia yamanashiensis]|uniref:CoA transferase n=1 Tax=Nocardia yamanashiensis TaxID=209247 RepID=UPI001E3EA668|nr:CoA transferase [Nocardia yamanashiensis]UGT38850.1 CoA transferase [Nocardia yamanashiensis]